MRQQSRVKVEVRGTVIGGAEFLTCLPIVAEDEQSALQEVVELIALKPDLLEWRVDAIKGVAGSTTLQATLKAIRARIGQTPLIFTCRTAQEGGIQDLTQQQRLNIINQAVRSGEIDLVDIELCNDDQFFDSVVKSVSDHQVKLIASHHNFTETPGEEFILATLQEAQSRGADIAKIAVMPSDYSDVLVLLSATNRARCGPVDIPMITISMGEEGAISRQAGGLFGSDVTFGSGRQSSAPGQIPIEKLQRLIELIYRS